MRQKIRLGGIAFLALSIACGIAERVFYGARLDENGILQESWFLPLSALFFLLGIVLLISSFLFRKR
ncbi:DUF3955 domain-containing protein [Cohaesibacter haloalkalitolerans]|uniref:DUF3955 domain-containing protein n=1 Tax=Cohaesibacter haloalkalitolerans TaxID=1162980 RepID=UPI0013C528E7